jgi:DNA-directed RNA polymerase subunit RPC12/RpoP
MKRHEEGQEQEQPSVSCPFCGSADVELLALFGSQLLTDQYYCRACHTPFEHLRADADDDERAGSAHLAHQGE